MANYSDRTKSKKSSTLNNAMPLAYSPFPARGGGAAADGGGASGGNAPAPVTLNALTLSASSIAENSLIGTAVGNVQQSTAGSTITMIDTAGGRFQISGLAVQAGSVATDYETATSHNITLRETHSSGTNSPKDTVLAITVTDVAEGGTTGQPIGLLLALTKAA